MSGKVVYILGAGFSAGYKIKAPLQSKIINDIFKLDFNSQQVRNKTGSTDLFYKYLNDIKKFLTKTCFISEENFDKILIEDIYTSLDRAITDNTSFRNLSFQETIQVKHKLNALISLLLVVKLENVDLDSTYVTNFAKFLVKQKLSTPKQDNFSIISTNWDIILDKALALEIYRNSHLKKGLVDYCIYTAPFKRNEYIIPPLVAKGKGYYNIKMLKVHGSMNWLQCKRCQRMFITMFDKIVLEEYIEKPICRFCQINFRDNYGDGGAKLTNQLIMPTFLKDLNNTQLKLIWQNAGVELSEASKIVFIGYSFPLADFELRRLLANNVRHNVKIEVILHKTDKPLENYNYLFPEFRYKSFFGMRNIKFSYSGVYKYIKKLTTI